MTELRSSSVRPFGSLVQGFLVLGLMLAGWAAFAGTVEWSKSGGGRRPRAKAVLRQPLFAVPAALVLLFGLPMVAVSFARSRGRYRLGPTELEISEGFLGRETRTLPYAQIDRIDTSRGPLMRLLGTWDLRLILADPTCPVTLHGIRGGDEIRARLLERRDSLRDLKKAEEDESTSRAVERLAKILERLEKRA